MSLRASTALLTLMLVGAACLDPSSKLTLQIDPPRLTLAAGTTASLVAVARRDGQGEDVTTRATWQSLAPAIATVDASGNVRALAPGEATVNATFEGVTAAVALTVTNAGLVRLAISPGAPQLAKGTSIQMSATGTFSDDSTQELASEVEWQVGDGAVASVSGNSLTAVDAGSTTLTATHLATGISATVPVTVTAAAITSVMVEPVEPTVFQGSSAQMTATATLTDGLTRDVTTDVTWSSNAEAFATVDAGGLVTAVAPGSAVITATASGGEAGSTTVTVVAAVVSLAVTPRAPQTPLGVPVQLTVTATLSDATSRDVTAEVSWSTAPAGIVSVSSAAASAGEATPLAEGTATVSASLGSLSSDDTDESATMTVLPAALVSLTVSPDSPRIPKGATRSLGAEGRYTDGSTRDVTGSVTWSSDAEAIATVSSGGQVTAVQVGDATIAATDPTSGTRGQTTVTVSPAELVSISISPAQPSVQVGASVQLSAEGVLTDGSRQDWTQVALWEAANDNAVVSSAPGSEGLLTGVSPGTVDITATDPASGVFGSVNASVVDQVAAPTFSPPGGHYSQQQTVTLTSEATATIWYTSDGSQPACGGGTQYTAPFLLKRSAASQRVMP